MQAHDSDNDDNGDYFNPEEEVAIGDAKNCELPVNVVKSGEENEELIFKMRARLYRWRDNEWKERGTGEVKLLRDKTEKRIRFVLRQDKTLKAVANFIVAPAPLCELKPHQGSEKMFFFVAYDFSDEEAAVEKFVIKLGNADNAKKFKEAFNDARQFNIDVKEGKKDLKFAPVIKEEKEEEKEEKKDEKKEEKKEETK